MLPNLYTCGRHDNMHNYEHYDHHKQNLSIAFLNY